MSKNNLLQHITVFAVAVAVTLASLQNASGDTRLRNICRVKGQEENVLRGLGLVVGLNGTGPAGDGPTMRAVARAMEVLGSPVGTTGTLDAAALNELKSIKNAALVVVTATVPATGARRGEKIDCTVSALNGKGLQGGQLTFAALQGPNLQDPRVFALCNGSVQIEDATIPTVGTVQNGCQLEQDVFTPFFLEQDGGMYITLVLDKNHASFHAADDVARKIGEDYSGYYSPVKNTQSVDYVPQQFVVALDATNIRVRIPDSYRVDPVAFTAEVLETIISEEDPEARVVINTRSNTIVISGDVRIGDVVVVHKNVVVEAGISAEVTALDDGTASNPSLERLVEQLTRLKVTEADVIEIIRRIDRAGKLHGKLIIQ